MQNNAFIFLCIFIFVLSLVFVYYLIILIDEICKYLNCKLVKRPKFMFINKTFGGETRISKLAFWLEVTLYIYTLIYATSCIVMFIIPNNILLYFLFYLPLAIMGMSTLGLVIDVTILDLLKGKIKYETLIGAYRILSEVEGKSVTTNEKYAIIFTSNNEAKIYGLFNNGQLSLFCNCLQAKITFAKNSNGKFAIEKEVDKNTFFLYDNYFLITTKYEEFEAQKDSKLVNVLNGENIFAFNGRARFVIEKNDYSKRICSIWEGVSITKNSLYDDNLLHRWEFKEDGTFIYYKKIDDAWIISGNSLNEYFVVGNLLCTKWIDGDNEFQESWEIIIREGSMEREALRKNENDELYIVKFEMKNIDYK